MDNHTRVAGESSPTALSADDIKLILKHRDHFEPGQSDSYIAAGSVGSQLGSGELTIGGLIRLWRSGQWVVPCTKCRGRLHLIRVAGSLLSGKHTATGVCLDCGEQSSGPLPGAFGKYAEHGLEAYKATRMPMVERSSPRHGFSWKDGVSAHPTGVNITHEPQFETVTLAEKLRALRAL
jgi:hypothetical protein